MKIASVPAAARTMPKTIIKISLAILLLSLFENIMPAIARIPIQTNMQVATATFRVVGKLANIKIIGVKHNKPINDIIQNPINSRRLIALSFTSKAVEAPPTRLAINAKIPKRKIEAIATNTTALTKN